MNLNGFLENRIKCGQCGTEFDLYKNMDGCPLCGFGKKNITGTSTYITTNNDKKQISVVQLTNIPPSFDLKSGKVITDAETQTWGSMLMCNDFFAPKFLARVLAWKMYQDGAVYITLDSLMKDAIKTIEVEKLSQLKGFPNLKKDWSGKRLVDHFLKTFTKMGFFSVEPIEDNTIDVWKESWNKIKISLTKEGLEFAQIRNPVFDDKKNEQILSYEEKKWLIDYLKIIDGQGYKEFSILMEVLEFLKEGKNGNKDLWEWFVHNEKFQNRILEKSKRARENEKIFGLQLWNYARSFSSAKISMLRELNVVKNKRNDYTIIGDL